MSFLQKLKKVVGIYVTYEDGVCMIVLNRPEKLNPLNYGIYNGIREVLNITVSEDCVKLVYLTGNGRYFSSGNEMSFDVEPPKEGDLFFTNFVKAFIDYPKLIVVGVNGPAVGLGVTILPLADFVYATDVATFYTPFTKLGLIPEACSSYTFPKIMGYARANEVLIGGKKLSVQEAFTRGLVSDIFKKDEFKSKVQQRIKYLSALPRESVKASKALIRDKERDILHEVNDYENKSLKERYQSDEFLNAAMAFIAKSSKL